ncbi:nicotinate-nicotinamide nucleotide adenylyltransferase [Candidatus Poribacteria bacterium]|nr:nicotinate-nicotinamide nucleotide adenylyltransferase [Candidatus Poribacteria bacterium]
MRLAIFGGTFDPPHMAHVMAVAWALHSGEVDRVLVVPAARHAFGKQPAAPFADRIEMCRLAVSVFAPGLVEVLDIEGRREGTSYMVDTVRELQLERAGDSFRLLVGSDIVPDLPKWRESGTVLRLAPPLVVPRQGEGAAMPGALPMLSSTFVREALARGEDIAGLAPYGVLKYVAVHVLYGNN